ncbi:MAG TPA: L,D-transpeptidase [Pseudonocardiaceae bacterium]|jgi:lipoprotein-anchoring transpeptidase ErfK/SrfK|nr:L,D-transpeptidase [Pseudonocardiaceae bacterium]
MRIARHTATALAVASATAVLTGGLAGTAVAQASTPCGNSAEACVDLSSNQAWLQDGAAISYGPVPITTGKPGHATPPGWFKVSYKDRHHRSRAYHNAPMPYSVFFNGGIAFHAGSLEEQSHGCIHLSTGAAKTFFNDLQPGDPVEVVP